MIYKAKEGHKTIDLDVSRKATITVNGKSGTLDLVKVGQKPITYEADLQVATKIDATGNGKTDQMSFVEVAELGNVFAACLSEDGLTVYYQKRWQKPTRIYTAHRKDAESLFENERPLFDGAMPAATNDGLEVIFIGDATPGDAFYSASRKSVNESFKRPKPINELRELPSANTQPRCPNLSSDGLVLYFIRNPEKGKIQFAFSTRPDRHSPWGKPQPHEVEW